MYLISPLRTLPFKSGTSFSVNGGLGGHICVKMLDHDSMGGRGGRAMIVFLACGRDELCWALVLGALDGARRQPFWVGHWHLQWPDW